MSTWIDDYYADVDAMRLEAFVERRNLWFVNDDTTAVLEVVTHYTTKSGANVPVPCVSLLDRNADGKVTSLRVYIDLAPLFAQIGAEEAGQPEAVTA